MSDHYYDWLEVRNYYISKVKVSIVPSICAANIHRQKNGGSSTVTVVLVLVCSIELTQLSLVPVVALPNNVILGLGKLDVLVWLTWISLLKGLLKTICLFSVLESDRKLAFSSSSQNRRNDSFSWLAIGDLRSLQPLHVYGILSNGTMGHTIWISYAKKGSKSKIYRRVLKATHSSVIYPLSTDFESSQLLRLLHFILSFCRSWFLTMQNLRLNPTSWKELGWYLTCFWSRISLST